MSSRVLRNLFLGSLTLAFVIPLPILWQQPIRIAAAAAAGPSGPVPAQPTDLSFSNPAFKATLVDAKQKARNRAATVQVEVNGVRLVDPDGTTGKPVPGEGHLHFQVDNGPVIATTATRLGFHDLAAGNHLVKIILAGNDHKAISAQQTIDVTIPAT